MKKEYDTPKAEKLEFNYQESVVASGSLMDGKEGNAVNGCYDGSNAKNQSGKCVAKYV